MKPRQKETEDEIQKSVERKLKQMLNVRGEKPTREELQALNLAIKFLAVRSKMQDDQWASGLADLGKELDDELEEEDDDTPGADANSRGPDDPSS
jgi:hypothetical protein